MVGGRSLWPYLKWVLPDWWAQVSGTCSTLFLLYGRGPGRSWMERDLAGWPWSSLGQSCWHADDLRELQMCWPPHRRVESALSTRWSVTKRGRGCSLMDSSESTFSSTDSPHAAEGTRTSQTGYANGSFKGKDPDKGILVSVYSFSFKAGCYSFSSSSWQKLCGSGDLNAARHLSISKSNL